MTAPSDIRLERAGPLAVVTLNRPKALNALTLDMLVAFDAALADWAGTDDVLAVVVRGAGDRAFCAGGDIKAVWEAGRARQAGLGDGALTERFFRAEYALDRRIHHFPKPYIALMDGITMGGGVGVSIHGSHRVVTERTLFAMPEVGIGLFPDIGASFFLPRMPGELGAYLGLTGARLHAADALYAGVGTNRIGCSDLDGTIAALSQSLDDADDVGAAVDAVLRKRAVPAGRPPLAEFRARIDHCFRHDTVEEIVGALSAEQDEWAREALAAMRQASPTSLKVTHEAIRRGASLDIDACLAMEFRLSQAFLARHDVYEGVRAVLVDKDRRPRWSPSDLQGVTDAEVDAHFEHPVDPPLTFLD